MVLEEYASVDDYCILYMHFSMHLATMLVGNFISCIVGSILLIN